MCVVEGKTLQKLLDMYARAPTPTTYTSTYVYTIHQQPSTLFPPLPNPLLTTTHHPRPRYLTSTINFVRDNLHELCPTVSNNMAQSLMRVMDCYLDPFRAKEGSKPPEEEVFVQFEAGLVQVGSYTKFK